MLIFIRLRQINERMLKNWFTSKHKKSAELPAFWRAYEETFAQSHQKNTPIEGIRFVCFDTETTGLDPRNDQILSIGAVAIHHWSIDIDDRFECLVHQVYEPMGDSIAVHGILPVDRGESIRESAAIPAFLDFIKDAVLVGHHIGFDISMIQYSLQELTGEKLKLLNYKLDTIRLARRLLPSHHHLHSGELSLDQLANNYGISLSGRHTASGDAYITAILFLKLLSRLKKRGNNNLGHLLRR